VANLEGGAPPLSHPPLFFFNDWMHFITKWKFCTKCIISA